MNLIEKELAYWERNQLVLYLSKLYPSWIEKHPPEDPEWEDEFRNLIFIQFPEGIFSWQVNDLEMKYFKNISFRENLSQEADSEEEKYEKLRGKLIL